VGFKFTRHDERKVVNIRISEQDAAQYPTAYRLLMEYDDICPMMSLNVLAPHTILHRHYGPENVDGRYIRIHIPLIIPKGDIFLEVHGQEVTWRDLFGFDNTVVHSAHNYSDHYRLVVLIDLDREAIGMEPGLPYDPEIEKHAPPFVRGQQ
jgi:aspartyl/asparaginyl beta-hydroxylase (cupin superfamily)